MEVGKSTHGAAVILYGVDPDRLESLNGSDGAEYSDFLDGIRDGILPGRVIVPECPLDG